MSAVMGIFRGAERGGDAVVTRLAQIQAAIPPTEGMARQFPQIRSMALTGLGRLAAAKRMADSLSPNDGRYFVQMVPVWGGFAPPGYADSLLAELESVRQAGSSAAGGSDAYSLYFEGIFFLGQGDVDTAGLRIDRGLALDSIALARYGGAGVHGLFVAMDGWRTILRGDTTAGIRQMAAGLTQLGPLGGPAITAPLRLQRAITLSRRPSTRDEGIRMLRYGFGMDPQYIAITQFALGEALEAAGEPAGALEAYGEFIRYWQQADPALQPKVQQAREAMTRLQRAGG